jgi:hypothetical protein
VEYQSAPFGPVAPPPPRPAPGGTLYSSGNPTDEEQLYLEFINRSRANPPAEGTRLRNTTDPDVLSAYETFTVDLALMESQFAVISPAPPLAMNPKLLTAARLHSGDMYTNDFQGHTGSTGSTLGSRASAQGYTFSTLGENVFARADSIFYGHAGFNVDWGIGPGGMQFPPGHRNSINSPAFREVGVGVVLGVNGSVGPQLVTQDFGTQQGAIPFITGVVYYDFNRNNFYDLGEGVGGVNVDVSGSTFFAVTANSGGYAVPVPGDGQYTVTFTANSLATSVQTATVSSARNVKVNYVPAYSPPVISGPDAAGTNQYNLYTFTPVGAATGYQWEQAQLSPFTLVEGAENGLGNVISNTTPVYPVIQTAVKASGTSAFHLAHPSPAEPQLLTVNRSLLANASSQLTFKSRLGTAAADQVARVQVSADQGQTWQDVYSQPGAGIGGETSFVTRNVSLAAFAGKTIMVRFNYDFSSGSFFGQTSSGVGWYIDDISFTNVEELSGIAVADVPNGTSFAFVPLAIGKYSLRVRAQIMTRTLDWGPAKFVNAANVPTVMSLRFTDRPSLSGTEVQMDFDVTNYRTGAMFQLQKANSPSGPWSTDNSASIQTIVPNTQFRAITSTGGANQTLYRLVGN